MAEVYPETAVQRCWVHKLRNVLDKLPDRLQEKAKDLLRLAMYADSRKEADQAKTLFGAEFGEKHEKAVACLQEDWDELLTFLNFPAEHWLHLHSSNVIESVFSPAKVRARKTKGAGSRRAGLALAYKLVASAQSRWRKINAPHRVRLLREGVRFKDGQVMSEAQKPETAAVPERVAA